MSSEGFNPNEALWAKAESSAENEFLVEQEELGDPFFESKPLSSLRKGLTADVEEPPEEAVLIDISEVDKEAEPEEPAESTVTFTESEYNGKLAQARTETESRVREELEAKSRLELNQLKEQQEEFFHAVMESLAAEAALTSDVTALALKIGTFLARAQLRLDEKVVSQFIESSLQGNELNESHIVTIRVSNSWLDYRAALNGLLPDGLGLIFDEALQPGDVVVSAGQGGYFDVLEDRVKLIEDQLSSVEHPDSTEWLADSFRQFMPENRLDDPLEVDQSEHTLGASDEGRVITLDDAEQVEESDSSPVPIVDESATTSPPDEIKVEPALIPAPENQEQGSSVDPVVDGGSENVDDEIDA